MVPRVRNYSPRRPEPISASGAVLLGFNQLALLHGLYDRPQGRAESSADLTRAAIPYVRLFRDPNWWCLSKAVLSLHPEWVEKGRDGRRNTWILKPRGRAIVERAVPAYLRGIGPYEGLAPYRERSKQRRQREHLDARIEAMGRSVEGRELLARLECAMFAWSWYFGPTSMASAYAHEHNKPVLRGFLQRHIVRHGAMPTGIHDVGNIARHSSRVDFDLLVGPLPPRHGKVTVENTGRHLIVRPATNFVVKRLCDLARDGAEWRGDALYCEPTVVSDVLRAVHADN